MTLVENNVAQKSRKAGHQETLCPMNKHPWPPREMLCPVNSMFSFCNWPSVHTKVDQKPERQNCKSRDAQSYTKLQETSVEPP